MTFETLDSRKIRQSLGVKFRKKARELWNGPLAPQLLELTDTRPLFCFPIA